MSTSLRRLRQKKAGTQFFWILTLTTDGRRVERAVMCMAEWSCRRPNPWLVDLPYGCEQIPRSVFLIRWLLGVCLSVCLLSRPLAVVNSAYSVILLTNGQTDRANCTACYQQVHFLSPHLTRRNLPITSNILIRPDPTNISRQNWIFKIQFEHPRCCEICIQKC